jgi:hypothetical protein
MKTIYRESLDGMTCQNPGCDHTSHDHGLYLSPGCHPGGPVFALYDMGVLKIECATCHRPVAEVAVAWKSQVKDGIE